MPTETEKALAAIELAAQLDGRVDARHAKLVADAYVAMLENDLPILPVEAHVQVAIRWNTRTPSGAVVVTFEDQPDRESAEKGLLAGGGDGDVVARWVGPLTDWEEI